MHRSAAPLRCLRSLLFSATALPPAPPAFALAAAAAARRALQTSAPARSLLLAAQARPPAAPLLLSRGFAAAADKSLKFYKPTSPGQRGRVTTSRKGLWGGKPIKALTFVRPRFVAAPPALTRRAGLAQERRAQQPRAHH
jgi:hypothetical protein